MWTVWLCLTEAAADGRILPGRWVGLSVHMGLVADDTWQMVGLDDAAPWWLVMEVWHLAGAWQLNRRVRL